MSNLSKDDLEIVSLITEIIGILENLTPEQVLAEARRRAQQSRERAMKRYQRFQSFMRCMTDRQSLRVAQQEAKGYTVNKVFQHRGSGNVAVMLVNNNLWNSAKGRMGVKIMMVYPDATSSETFEKTITVKQDF